MRTMSILFLPLTLLAAAAISGCLSSSEQASQKDSQEQDGTKSPGSQPESKVQVNSVEMKDGVLAIGGDHLNSVKKIQIRSGEFTTELSIESRTSNSLLARILKNLEINSINPMTLILSTANADTAVPLSFELKDGSVTMAKLGGSGAKVGDVMKWNGKEWIPAADYVFVADKRRFAGFTKEYIGELGGFKGGNEKCNAEYPGSHWAGYKELVELGPDYTWEYRVWVWDILEDDYFQNTAGERRVMSKNCMSWLRARYPSGSDRWASTLSTDGALEQATCITPLRLACMK